jgi:ribonuclease HI
MPERPSVTIYSDGGCKPNPGPGGWGVVLIASNGYEKELSGGDPDTTNNRMELTAAVEALRALKEPCDVTFYTDSQYLRRGITEWLPGWIKKGWRRKGDQPVLNEDLWRALQRETQRHSIDWQWVKGHAGDEYNERVDGLATAARAALTGEAETPAGVPDVEIALRVSLPKSSTTGGWAVRIAEKGKPPALFTGREEQTSANRLELVAALAALHKTPAEVNVRVYCASDYLLLGMTQWADGWLRRNWTTTGKQPVKHRDLWQALLTASSKRSVDWVPEGDSSLARGLDALAAQAAKG